MGRVSDEQLAVGLERRDLALERLCRVFSVGPEVKRVVREIILLLEPGTGYRAAWPTHLEIAAVLGLSRSTVGQTVAKARAAGLFDVSRFRVREADRYLERLGAVPKIEGPRTTRNIYEVNFHPIWDASRQDYF